MKKVVLEFSPETIKYFEEGMLDLINTLKKTNKRNKELMENWDKPIKKIKAQP